MKKKIIFIIYTLALINTALFAANVDKVKVENLSFKIGSPQTLSITNMKKICPCKAVAFRASMYAFSKWDGIPVRG